MTKAVKSSKSKKQVEKQDLENLPLGQVQEEGTQQPAPNIQLSIDSVNQFLQIVNIIMIGDERGRSIEAHFIKMLESANPGLRRADKQPQVPQEGEE